MEWVACVAVDWAEQEHAYELRTPAGERWSGVVGSAPEMLHEWIRSVRGRFPDGQILFVVEDGRSSLIDALMGYPFLVIIRINPVVSKRYRSSRRPSGASSDASDASLLCDYALKHLDEVRVWKPADETSRKLRALTETRRNFVDQRTSLMQEFAATLKGYFPQILGWLRDVRPNVLWQFVLMWPTLEALRHADPEHVQRIMRAHRLRKIAHRVETLTAALSEAVALTNDSVTIEMGALRATALAKMLETVDQQIDTYDQAIAEAWSTHPDRDIFDALPGAGPVLAPRLAATLTTDRDRFNIADEIECYSGIAPVCVASGKRVIVHARFQFPVFVHQSFHEFAESSLPHSSWALEVYRVQREAGANHHTAIRAVAFRWIRIIFRLWQDRLTYDDAIHLANLRRRGSPVAARLAA